MQTIEGTSPPSDKTVGSVGDLYVDTNTNIRYKLGNISNIKTDRGIEKSYHWQKYPRVLTKLSDLENDVFYYKKIPFLTLTKDDFVVDGNTAVYIGSQHLDWITQEDDIYMAVTLTVNGRTYHANTDDDGLCDFDPNNCDSGSVELYFDWYKSYDLNEPDSIYNFYGYIRNMYDYINGTTINGFSVWFEEPSYSELESVTFEICKIEHKGIPIELFDRF